MRVYLAAVGAHNAPTHGVASIERIQRRAGDSEVVYRSWTSGTLSRGYHADEFLGSEYDAIFMLDCDMRYPADCLERLRDRDLPITTGLYLRRDVGEMLPAAWEEPLNVEEFPLIPLLDFPQDDLIPVGAVGHGFLLVKRKAMEDIAEAVSPGPLMLRAPMPEWTGQGDLHVGPDVRMCLWARRLGYRIWMDTGCRAEHYITGSLRVEDYEQNPSRGDNQWKGRTALARILRRGQMGKNISKKDLLLYAEQKQRDLNKLLAEKEALVKAAQEYTVDFEAKMSQIEASIHAHNGALITLKALVDAESGKSDIKRG